MINSVLQKAVFKGFKLTAEAIFGFFQSCEKVLFDVVVVFEENLHFDFEIVIL